MYYRVKFGTEVKVWDIAVFLGRQYLVWNYWLIDPVEWTTSKYGHQN